jgi:ubiquinone/menaquinone biosynthesis C-methylase UbiE
MPYYPSGTHITGIDISAKMLACARRRAADIQRNVTLRRMDAQTLEFADDAFDSAIATFVFCSVPDPVSGMREIDRVVKPDGLIVLLEYMKAHNPILGERIKTRRWIK